MICRIVHSRDSSLLVEGQSSTVSRPGRTFPQDKHKDLTRVDDLVPFQVSDAVEDSSTDLTWMDVPLEI